MHVSRTFVHAKFGKYWHLLSCWLSRSYSSYNVCIVGSGPAGFYTAQRLFRRSHDDAKIASWEIDLLEKLPTPYGLIRYGVAPDHPEVKNCITKFEELVSADKGNIEWVGGINIGTDVTIPELCAHYDAVVLAVGAQKERHIGVGGEDTLKHIYSSQQWVGWINGYPNGNKGLNDQMNNALTFTGHGKDKGIVIGHGNVALDVARILLSPLSLLKSTDISHAAMESLCTSSIRHINIVGRRGPAQVSFTAKELRELCHLCEKYSIPMYTNAMKELNDIPMDHPSFQKNRSLKRVIELMKKYFIKNISLNDWEKITKSSERSLMISFMSSPALFHPDPGSPLNVGSVVFNKNVFSQIANEVEDIHDIHVTPLKEDKVTLSCALVVKCIGYQVSVPGLPISLLESTRYQYVPNERGKVLFTPNALKNDDMEREYRGLYVSGWCKRGPSGVIASTLLDAHETADSIVDDMTQSNPVIPNSTLAGRSWLISTLKERQVPYLTFVDWLKIDEEEKRKGKQMDKSREKMTSFKDMLQYSSCRTDISESSVITQRDQ